MDLSLTYATLYFLYNKIKHPNGKRNSSVSLFYVGYAG